MFFLEYTRECAYDESLMDATLNHPTECDTLGRCPMNSYCNTQTNRCCVKGTENGEGCSWNSSILVITAILPYRMCTTDRQCGKNMVCLSGLCECAQQNFIPARKKRECSE